jgi:hypothetical protein
MRGRKTDLSPATTPVIPACRQTTLAGEKCNLLLTNPHNKKASAVKQTGIVAVIISDRLGLPPGLGNVSRHTRALHANQHEHPAAAKTRSLLNNVSQTVGRGNFYAYLRTQYL